MPIDGKIIVLFTHRFTRPSALGKDRPSVVPEFGEWTWRRKFELGSMSLKSWSCQSQMLPLRTDAYLKSRYP